MPVKNAEKFLVACLDSILIQDYTNWELIAVENNSTDNSWGMLQAYQDRDPRIKIYQHKEEGIIPALQRAYAASDGRLVSRMDADDLMMPDKLSAMVNILKQEGRGTIAVGQVQYFSEMGVGNGYLAYAEWLNALSVKSKNFLDIYKECVIPSPAWMMWRDDFESCQGFDSELYPEDYDLCFRMYAAGYKVMATERIVHRWRDYPTRTSRIDPLYEDNRFLELKMQYFLQLDYAASKKLLLWGAGKKGKIIARYLVEHNIPYVWLCNNKKKVGHKIYGVTLEQSDEHTLLDADTIVQLVIAVGSPVENRQILVELEERGFQKGKNYFTFC